MRERPEALSIVRLTSETGLFEKEFFHVRQTGIVNNPGRVGNQ
jgi:hypothetical protein